MALDSLQDLYVDHIRDLYSAENQILQALPKMIDKAGHQELRDAFTKHRDETQQQARRLEEIAKRLGVSPEGKTCKGMQGVIQEGAEVIKENGDSDVLDAALIAAAQRVEHYEIAGYGCARTWANALGRNDDAAALQKTLDEESRTDEKLTQLAESIVNPDAETSTSESQTSSTSHRDRPHARPDNEARP
jgi:ferritin-like metal-binding protein YciE